MRLLPSTAALSFAALAACGGATSPVSGADDASMVTCRAGDACDGSATCPTGACPTDSSAVISTDAPEGDSGPSGDGHVEAGPLDPCGEVGPDDCTTCSGPCANGHCVMTLATSQGSYPIGIAVDATSVYWTDDGLGTVMKVSTAGGTAETLVSGLSSALAVTVDKTSIYWIDGSMAMRAALDGSSPLTLITGLASVGAIVVDAMSAYATSYDPGAVCIGRLVKAPLDGGMPSTLASGLCFPHGLATDRTSVYFAQVGPGAPLSKVPLGGGPLVTLVSSSMVSGIAVDSAKVYWVDFFDGLVLRVGLDGGTPETLASGQATPLDVAVDATGLYWTNEADPAYAPGTQGSVVKLALRAGCPPITLASGLRSPQDIAIDSTSVYWTDYSGGTVMKTSK